MLAALGVVYGDIGTSPLYALRECFAGTHPVPVTEANVLGVLSLILWSLIITVSVKYLLFVMRADNGGEGGILALVALVRSKAGENAHAVLIAIGLFGAALLYGDGMITPAISVLSAVEGLGIATNVFEPFVVPITVAILIVLFAVQRRGTAGIGKVFGPIMILWFVAIAALGVPEIARMPIVLSSIDPLHGDRVRGGPPAGIVRHARRSVSLRNRRAKRSTRTWGTLAPFPFASPGFPWSCQRWC